VVTTYLTSIQLLINGGYRHETRKKDETRQVHDKDKNGNLMYDADTGKPVMGNRTITRKIVQTVPVESNAKKIENLHPFPNTTFPMAAGNGMAAGMAGTLLRKRLEPAEEGWVEERIRKASDFCYVPPEWGVEPKKPEVKDEEDGSEDEAEDDGTDKRIPTTRVKTELGEDDINDLWRYAHQEVFDIQYLRRMYPDQYPEPDADGEGEGAEDGDEEEEEEEEGEEEEEEEEEEPEGTQAPVALKHAVHQPVPGVPILSLSFVHKFVETGDV
jgi:hypothetical protein